MILYIGHLTLSDIDVNGTRRDKDLELSTFCISRAAGEPKKRTTAHVDDDQQSRHVMHHSGLDG
jgi:hypothetical protein